MPESSDFEAPEVAAGMQGTVLATVDEWLNGDGRSGVPRLVQGGIQALIFLNVARARPRDRPVHR